MWQYCDRSCDNIVTGHVMLQYNGRYVTTNVTDHVTHHDRPQNIKTSWQHYDKNVTTSWQACGMEDHHDIGVKTQSNFYIEYYKQSQWILISWKLQILNVLFCGGRYCLEMYFSYLSTDFHTLGLKKFNYYYIWAQ